MDLWIRSQGRLKLVNNCNLYISNEFVDEFVIEDMNNNITLGTYKTKERALEVLDEIQETICLDEFNYENEEKTVYQDCYRYKSNIIAVYEMPKE